MSAEQSLRPGDLDLGNPETFWHGPPYAYFEMLRRDAPVSWNPPAKKDFGLGPIDEGFFVITKHEDAVRISKDPSTWSSHEGTIFIQDREKEAMEGLRLMMINQDPPKHSETRRTVSRGFTPKMVRVLEEQIRAKATKIVDDVIDRGECEFVSELAAELPLLLICELLGVPVEDRRRIYNWSNDMIGGEDPEMSDRAKQEAAAAESYVYAQALATEKRAAPDDTLISKFVVGSDGERAVSEDEIANFFIILQAAGSETTRNTTTHAIRLFCDHPDQLALLRSDMENLLPKAVEEILRVSAPVIVMRRTAMKDTEVRGVDMKKGAKVGLYYASFNRDEEVFDRPNEFDITRDPNPHLTFGIGQHFCLGANLARMQLRCILREIYTRLDDIEIVGEPNQQRSALIDGIKSMQVRFAAR